MIFEIALPPPQYDYPYQGEVVINYVLSPDEMNRRCYGVGRQIIACAFTGDGHCTILIWSQVASEQRPTLIRHELAHCNGWPAHHPK